MFDILRRLTMPGTVPRIQTVWILPSHSSLGLDKLVVTMAIDRPHHEEEMKVGAPLLHFVLWDGLALA